MGPFDSFTCNSKEIRIAGAGHPVDWVEKKGVSASTFIVRHSVNCRGCQLMLHYHDGTVERRHISLKALIEAQHETLAEQCRKAIAGLKAADEEHRMKYVSAPLTSIFKARDDWMSKVALAVYDSERCEVGLRGLQAAEDALQRFRAGLKERDLPFEEPLPTLYRRADDAARQLRKYFHNGRARPAPERAAVMSDHLAAMVGRVIEIAEEIDKEYASPAEG